jgi:hypothetical protein
MIDFWCFNATFNNISAISWQPVLVVEEAGVPREKRRILILICTSKTYDMIIVIFCK